MNQKKYILCLVLSIISIVINAIVIVTFLSIFMPLIFNARFEYMGSFVMSVILFVLIIYAAALTLSILLCVKTRKRGNVKGLLITFIVIYALCILSLFGSMQSNSVVSLFALIFYGGLLALSCVALGTNGEATNVQTAHYIAPQSPAAPPMQSGSSIDAKLAELRRLKELMVITDEQYEDAVRKLINKEIQF